jgi:hypothetical protein
MWLFTLRADGCQGLTQVLSRCCQGLWCPWCSGSAEPGSLAASGARRGGSTMAASSLACQPIGVPNSQASFAARLVDRMNVFTGHRCTQIGLCGVASVTKRAQHELAIQPCLGRLGAHVRSSVQGDSPARGRAACDTMSTVSQPVRVGGASPSCHEAR